MSATIHQIANDLPPIHITHQPLNWGSDMVANWFEEAAHTLRLLPPVKVKGYASTWPDVVHDYWDVYGWHEADEKRERPTSAQITRLDQVMVWYSFLDQDQRKIVWFRSCGMHWKRICSKLNIGRTTAHHRFLSACVQVAAVLNTQHKKEKGKNYVRTK